jgi:16S rRNA (adenine1518-N6/adenine1519-N6)-dimethyltransferase
MLQKEVANRLTAKPKSKEYGAITVITSLFYDIRVLFNVSKSVFYVILLQRKGQLYLSSDDYKPFVKFIYSCFNSRRKKLKNNIDFNIGNDLYFKELTDKRAEELNLVEFIKLFLLLKSK